MGGFSSNIPVAGTILAMTQARAQNKASQDAVQGNYDRQAELMARQQERQVQDRQDLLKRATATQRARLGAMGIGGASGSSDALINGLQRQTATELADLQSAYDINMSTLDWNRQRQEDQLGLQRQQQWASLVGSTFNSLLPSKKKQAQTSTRTPPEGDFFNLL